jgi:hypothetical protein
MTPALTPTGIVGDKRTTNRGIKKRGVAAAFFDFKDASSSSLRLGLQPGIRIWTWARLAGRRHR